MRMQMSMGMLMKFILPLLQHTQPHIPKVQGSLFYLGLNQKHFGGNNKIAGVSINLGCTKGRGSSTRMFNYCNKKEPYTKCINQFISIR